MGLLAAALHTWVKLRLGLPGFSAVLWLVPLLVARIAARGSADGCWMDCWQGGWPEAI